MQGFRKVLYSVNEDMAEEALTDLQILAREYPNFVLYLMKLWQGRESWCMAWRNIPALRGHHTNNYAEVTVCLFQWCTTSGPRATSGPRRVVMWPATPS